MNEAEYVVDSTRPVDGFRENPPLFDRLRYLTNRVAAGLQSAGRHFGDDSDETRSRLEAGARLHPVRSVVVALFAGFIVGKVFRR